jgi:hypothetical protein
MLDAAFGRVGFTHEHAEFKSRVKVGF